MYEVPASKKSLKQNQFEVKLNGQTFVLPSMKYLKPSLMAKSDELSEIGFTKMLMTEVAPGLFEAFEDGDQMEAFVTAWQEFSGISLGESEASTDS